ncbi:ATP-binding protein [Pyxidicoccus trucidator]|uniref:sensor histidine kinase n=1 Tax=Pyxidicoccus trucidator TaxID=2709662 RepID=UPI0013DB96D7|nr:ATP-binding protein [Pyxidicoccus trucidator]
MEPRAQRPATTWLPGESELASLTRALDWSKTPVGPMEAWPHSLRGVLSTLLTCRQPMFLWWGQEMVQFYNDAYRPSLGVDRHPSALGARGREFWTDIWDVIGPLIHRVQGGESVWFEDQRIPIQRGGGFQEVFWTFSYSPVRDDDGGVGGVLVVCTETTQKVLGERRLRTFKDLAVSALDVGDEAAAGAAAETVLARNAADVPFSALYLGGADSPFLRRVGLTGLEPHSPAAPQRVEPTDARSVWPLWQALRTGRPVWVSDVQARVPGLAAGLWPEPVRDACVLPLPEPGGEGVRGVLLVGCSPRLSFGPELQDFFALLASQLGAVLARASAGAERERLLVEVARAHAGAEAERTRLRNLLEAAPAVICTLRGPEHVFELANPLYQELVSGKRSLRGRTVAEALPEVAEQGFIQLLDDVYRTGKPFVGQEVRLLLDRQGTGHLEETFLTFIYQARRGVGGEVEGIDVFAFEVTEQVLARRRAESVADALRRSEERSRMVEQAAGVGTWELDLATRWLRMDAITRELLALPGEDDLSLEAVLAVILAEDRGHVVEAIESALRGERAGAFAVEYRVATPGGAVRWVEGRGRAYFDAGGRPERFLGTAMDISVRKEAEQQTRRSAEFEQQLIGIVSHDLRNPLSSILLGAQTVLRGEGLSERQLRNTLRIQTSAERAVRMIHDLLDFTQARMTGGLPVRPEPLDLHALVRQVVDEVQVSHPERTVRLEQQGEGRGAWDAGRVAQVVSNLLSNALAYSPADTLVTVTTRGEAEALVLEVHNTGSPIPADVLPRLFRPMERGVPTDSTRRSVGLGLYIVDQVVRSHGGRVEVRSSVEQGTVFTVRLPRNVKGSAPGG